VDYCCGLTMVAELRTVYTEGGSIIHDVPFLFCPTCHRSIIAPDVDFDFTMYAHYCETDGLKVASLADVVVREKLLDILHVYAHDERVKNQKRVLPEQIDAVLDLLNVAKSLNDSEWHFELTNRLTALHAEMKKPTQS